MGTTYDQWVESLAVPVYKGYYVEDLRTLELGRWEKRGCNAAILKLVGQEGVGSSRVMEIPPGKALPPWKFALDEMAYVLEGNGLATVWGDDSPGAKTFEWGKYSLFLIPRQTQVQLSNARGDRPARLLFYNYLPLVMQAVEDPEFFFDNPYKVPPSATKGLDEFYSQAKALHQDTWGRDVWYGNFFPDMRAWDNLKPYNRRGAGGHSVFIQFPDSPVTAHMSTFPARTYKKCHRHGPGICIVIPAGEGYSIMWEEGKEKVVVPWHEASVFVPPDRWFHQHFNVGTAPARYLALHPPRANRGNSERVTDARDQIEYADEDPWVRELFAEELAKRHTTSLMPDQVYKDRSYQWRYGEGKES